MEHVDDNTPSDRRYILRPACNGSRVLEERFGTIDRVAVVPKGKATLLAYVSEFIEGAKESGLLQHMIEVHKLRGMRVAPPSHAGPK
jgi:hypothetical protein